jgi:hypothetical protein
MEELKLKLDEITKELITKKFIKNYSILAIILIKSDCHIYLNGINKCKKSIKNSAK